MPSRRRTGPGSLLLAAVLVHGCQQPPAVPWRAEADRSAPVDAAASGSSVLVWVSYQIAVVRIDGRDVALRADRPCVYYPVRLPAGDHELSVRLDYRGPIQAVRSAAEVPIQVRLVVGREYRLLDLEAGMGPGREFSPWLQEGAPPRGAVPKPPDAGGSGDPAGSGEPAGSRGSGRERHLRR